ncbi:MAG: 1,4-alpha-glucan branching protein GlgB [Velocimicrobium sp.]
MNQNLCDKREELESTMDNLDINRFEHGIHYTIYEKMGAHLIERDGIKGATFVVWAPNASSVSVVGDFNEWNGTHHVMKPIRDTGIFELFIPHVVAGMIYKYNIKLPNGLSMLKADPYAFAGEMRPNTASMVCNLKKFRWSDAVWLKKRKKADYKKEPMLIYEVHLGSWKKPKIEGVEQNESFYNYRELAVMLAEYVKDMGYTHIELMPVMEHPFDGSWGYQVTGYYAPTARFGTPEDFMFFMNYMHRAGIGVILDWVPAHFPRDSFGLASFDGNCLYENKDPRRGTHPHWGTLIFDYGRPEVSNFLIANALFWADKYHADGIRMDAVASMLYLDYGKNEGEWLPNIYGGNENLEAIEMLKHLNSIFHKREDGAIVIAEESTSWPMITKEVEDRGLGFDLKWNMGWMNDFLDYIKTDPLFRSGKQGELTFSMIYAYSEKFLLVLSHDEVVHGKGSMIQKMPGEYEDKFANLRVAFGFMMTHPGKKLTFMGQEFAQFTEWSEAKELDWHLLECYESHQKMQSYVRALNNLYQDYPALYQKDFSEDGFEWISSLDGEHSVVSFIRKGESESDHLLVVCNFTPVIRENFRVGVLHSGKYKETFNSDRSEFGGSSNVNTRQKISKKIPWDGRENSIEITLPGLGICVFTCSYQINDKTKQKVKKNK